jgi:MOSC domain-containing protein YiiM
MTDESKLRTMGASRVVDRGTVESVNVGEPRAVQVNGHTVTTAIWKSPVAGRVPLCGVNLKRDEQADRSVHGGPDKAVYAYAAEDADWWETELGVPLEPGAFGENLTVRGLPVSEAVIGEHWSVGTAVLQIAQPRRPCFKLGLRMGDPRFPKRFAAADRPGAYLRVLREGDIGAGDEIVVSNRPPHGVSCTLVARALLREPQLLGDALHACELPVDLREWMQERLGNRQ